MDVVKLFTAEPDDASRHADDRRVVRHLAQYDGIGRDAGVISDPKRPEHLRAGADHDVVPKRRVAFSDVLARAAKRHALIEQAVVTDLGGLADHNTGAVVNDEPPADLCAGMDLNPRPHFRPLRNGARQKAQVMDMQPVRNAVIDGRVQAVV